MRARQLRASTIPDIECVLLLSDGARRGIVPSAAPLEVGLSPISRMRLPPSAISECLNQGLFKG